MKKILKDLQMIQDALTVLNQDFSGYLRELGVEELTKVRITKQDGAEVDMCFDRYEVSINRWTQDIYIGIHGFKIKKDGTRSLVNAYVHKPTKIEAL